MVIEYADLECPYCAQTHLLLTELPVARVFRHFPVVSKHPRARVLAARPRPPRSRAGSGRCTTRCSTTRATSTRRTCGSAPALGIDLERFEADRRSDAVAERVERDFRSGIRAGVTTTPTQFAGGQVFPGVPGQDFQEWVAASLSRVRNETYKNVPPTGGG